MFLPPLILLNTSIGKLEDKNCTPNKCRDNIKLKKEEIDMPCVRASAQRTLITPRTRQRKTLRRYPEVTKLHSCGRKTQ